MQEPWTTPLADVLRPVKEDFDRTFGDTLKPGDRVAPYWAVDAFVRELEWTCAVQSAMADGKPVPESIVAEMMKCGERRGGYYIPLSRAADYPELAARYGTGPDAVPDHPDQ